jgi:hypothetical protein
MNDSSDTVEPNEGPLRLEQADDVGPNAPDLLLPAVIDETQRVLMIQPDATANYWQKSFSRISTWAVVIGAVTTIAGLLWLDHRIRKLEKQQSELAKEITDMRASQRNSANPVPAPPGLSNGDQQLPSGTGDLPANPKLPMSKPVDKSKTKNNKRELRMNR